MIMKKIIKNISKGLFYSLKNEGDIYTFTAFTKHSYFRGETVHQFEINGFLFIETKQNKEFTTHVFKLKNIDQKK